MIVKLLFTLVRIFIVQLLLRYCFFEEFQRKINSNLSVSWLNIVQNPDQVLGNPSVDSGYGFSGTLLLTEGHDAHLVVSWGAVHGQGGHEWAPRIPPASVLSDRRSSA